MRCALSSFLLLKSFDGLALATDAAQEEFAAFRIGLLHEVALGGSCFFLDDSQRLVKLVDRDLRRNDNIPLQIVAKDFAT